MWQLVNESSALQRRLVLLFVESCKQNNANFERLYQVIKRNSERWNRRFNKAVGV